MKKLICLLSICVMALLAGAQNGSDQDASGIIDNDCLNPDPVSTAFKSITDTGDVIHTVPAPGAKCNGLTWDGSALWTSDNNTKTIFKISPVDGTVISSFPYSLQFKYCEGMAWDGTHLIVSGWTESNGNGSKIYTLDPQDGSIIDSFEYPSDNPWPHGITFDGNYVWANDFNTKTLDKMDPETGELIDTIPAPGESSVGLTWDGYYLWSDDFQARQIYQINSLDGSIIMSFPSPTTNPRDMAFDGQYIWIASWVDQTIYQVDAGPAGIQEIPVDDFSICPNPIRDQARLSYQLKKPCHVIITILDLSGRETKTLLNADQSAGPQQLIIDREDLPGGAYILCIISDKVKWSKKIIVL